MAYEKYPHGTKTVEETDEYLASRRYIMHLYIDNDSWFTTPVVTMKNSREVYDAVKDSDGLLWNVSFKDSRKFDCVVKASSISWVLIENADPVYKEQQ